MKISFCAPRAIGPSGHLRRRRVTRLCPRVAHRRGRHGAPRPPALLLSAFLALQVLFLSRPSRGDDARRSRTGSSAYRPPLGGVEVCGRSFDVSVHWAHVSRCARVTGSLAITGILPDVFTTREPYNCVLWTVDGDALIERNALLVSLRGAFPGLTCSRAGTCASSIPRWCTSRAFESLREVNGAVFVADNARMLAFKDGVTVAFQSPGRAARSPSRTTRLEELDGFRALRRVGVGAGGGGVTIGPSVDMRYVVGAGLGGGWRRRSGARRRRFLFWSTPRGRGNNRRRRLAEY